MARKSKDSSKEGSWRVANETPLAIKITDPEHLLLIGAAFAARDQVKVLRELQEKTSVIGVSVALVYVEHNELKLRSRLLEMNYRLMAAHGIDISKELNVSLKNDILTVTPSVMTMEFIITLKDDGSLKDVREAS